jgi:hypothetical protein
MSDSRSAEGDPRPSAAKTILADLVTPEVVRTVEEEPSDPTT